MAWPVLMGSKTRRAFTAQGQSTKQEDRGMPRLFSSEILALQPRGEAVDVAGAEQEVVRGDVPERGGGTLCIMAQYGQRGVPIHVLWTRMMT